MPTARLNGVDLYYESTGTGPPLVLTHGSWTDGRGWSLVANRLSQRYRVVAWDRRGHSRSQDGAGPGSREEDADDLAALIEHLGDGPAHLVGSSYGGIVVLGMVARRPELAASAMVHEPPALGLLRDHADPAVADEIALIDKEIVEVLDLIRAGHNREAAIHFVERIAVGPGAWEGFPPQMRETLENNAPTWLDEQQDPTTGSVDVEVLAESDVPIQVTKGTDGPAWFAAAITELQHHLPDIIVETIEGAGHMPHATHGQPWVATLVRFHERIGAT